MKELYSTYQAAQICQAHHTSIINWIKQGKLNAYVTPGGHRRIEKADLLNFMKKYKIPVSVDLKKNPKRVLVVDDDPEAREELKEALSGNGYELDFAADGFEAGRKIYSLKPDLVLLDFRMPGMDGFQVCEILKKDKTTSRMPVIAVTVLKSEEDIARIRKCGVFAYVQKPFNIKELLVLIGQALKVGKEL